ncbi:MAG: TerC family protein, partial [Bauldia sp.]
METIWSELAALGQVLLIDLTLAADNAMVVGLAAAGLPAHQRRNAILIGIGAAAGLRIVFALITTELLALGWGLLVAGGLLLVWV